MLRFLIPAKAEILVFGDFGFMCVSSQLICFCLALTLDEYCQWEDKTVRDAADQPSLC